MGPGDVMWVVLLPNPYVPEPEFTEPAYNVIEIDVLEGEGEVDGVVEGWIVGVPDGSVVGDTTGIADGVGAGDGEVVPPLVGNEIS